MIHSQSDTRSADEFQLRCIIQPHQQPHLIDARDIACVLSERCLIVWSVDKSYGCGSEHTLQATLDILGKVAPLLSQPAVNFRAAESIGCFSKLLCIGLPLALLSRSTSARRREHL